MDAEYTAKIKESAKNARQTKPFALDKRSEATILVAECPALCPRLRRRREWLGVAYHLTVHLDAMTGAYGDTRMRKERLPCLRSKPTTSR